MPRFHVDQLRPMANAIMTRAGATEAEAQLVVEHALEALLTGEENHGQSLGTQYIAAIRDGTLRPGQPISIERESATTLAVNGNFNFGHYVSHETMSLLIDKAQRANVAAATIRYQCHVGRLIDYTSMAARRGMVALMMTDGAWGPKFVAPWGATERRLGVNPWSLAAPGPDGWIGFDMTSGAVSFMKVERARNESKAIPEGWIADRDGRPTTDPNAFFEGGTMLPMGGQDGGHKGYVLGFMIELLADVLSGMEFREDLSRPWPIIDGSFMAVFNVEAFRPLAEFVGDARSMIEYVCSAAPRDGARVYYPGQRGQVERQRRIVEGVEINDSAWARIVDLARELAVDRLVPAAI